MIQEGDLIELKEGMKVYAKIPACFNNGNYMETKGNFSLHKYETTIKDHFKWIAGKYIVTKTTMDGGGSSYDGGYPDGHHVFCQSVDNPEWKVDFYQTGCFTAMIKDIEPIGKAKLTWSVK